MKSYRTLDGRVTTAMKEKKSEFIANAAPVSTEYEAQVFLQEIRALHRTASHNVFAYSLRENARQRYSDDGEPAKTAGLPVLSVITHAEIEDCIIVVTRYFGGTLLGTGGLVRAYTASALSALESAKIVTVQPCIDFSLTVEYPMFDKAVILFNDFGVKTQNVQYTDVVKINATTLAGTEVELIKKLTELCRGAPTIEVGDVYYAPF